MTAEGRKGAIRSLGELPQGIEPEADLWPQIEAQIAGRADHAPVVTAPVTRAAGTRLKWLAAAAMVGCVAVGVWIGHSVAMRAAAAPPLAAAAASAGGTLQTAWVADPRYQREHAELLRSIGDRIDALPPASRAKVMASLTTIREAKHNLEEALGKDPGNALLQELLVNTYQDEMRVLTDVREASDAGKGI
jgi:dienelactone hydrolase